MRHLNIGQKEINMEISLFACRANTRMTQAQFAKKIGVSPCTVANWETGKTEPSLANLRKISEISGVPIDNIAIPSFSMNCNS